jgi:hypothetical protein
MSRVFETPKTNWSTLKGDSSSPVVAIDICPEGHIVILSKRADGHIDAHVHLDAQHARVLIQWLANAINAIEGTPGRKPN